MKHLSTILFVLVALMCVAATGYGQLLLQETFKDATSNIATLPNWSELSAGTIGSTVAPPYIVVKPNSALFYTGYIESGNGNSAYLSGGGQDAQVVVRDVTSGVVYLAFLIKVDSATAAGDYIWIVRNTSNHNRWRMWIKRDTSTASTTSFNFGISKGTTGMQYTASKYSFGTTYLVIAKYDFNTTATTDAKMNLWVNPPIGGASDDLNPVIKDYTDPGTDFVSINRLALVQNAVATAPTFSIGGIRMGGKWLEVLPPPPLYYNGTGAINDPNSWGKNSDGSGTRPSDFASDNQLYVVRNTTAVSLTAQWIVSGVGSKVIIGSSVNLTVASGGLLAAPAVDVNSGGTLTLTQSSFWPAFGDIAGTVSFNNASGFSLDDNYSFPTGSGYYDLKAGDFDLSGKTLTARGRLRLNGNKVSGTGTFKLDSAGTLYISSPSGISSTGAIGDIQSSTRQFSRYASYVYFGTANQVTGNGIPDTVANLSIQMANRTLTTTLSKFVASSGNLTLTSGKFKLGAFNLNFSNPAGQSDSSYVITDGAGALVRPVSNTSKKTMPVGSPTEYRVAALTMEGAPTATNIAVRYVSGDPGSAGYPADVTKHYKGGYWVITSDGTPAQTFRLDLGVSGITDIDTAKMRIISRSNSTTAWGFPGTVGSYLLGTLSEAGIDKFGQFAVASGASTTPPPAGKRYLNEVFANFQLQSNIQFGQIGTKTLSLDLYNGLGDTEKNRPLVIFIHGGGFKGGDKVGNFSTLVCGGLAKRGYVVASIDYRVATTIASDTAHFEAMLKALQDSKAAVRFFRKNAATYGVDATQIFATGSSAGSITALHLAYLDSAEVPKYVSWANVGGSFEGTSGNPGFASNVQGVISNWGAIGDTAWMKRGDVPVYSVHGTADSTVYYDRIPADGPFRYGSKHVFTAAQRIGLTSGLRTFSNTGHTLDDSSVKQDSAYKDFSAWLFTVLKPATTGVEETSPSIPTTIALLQNYPNPFNPATTISYELPSTALVSLRVYNLLGQQIAVLADDVKTAGRYRVTFDAARHGSGVYLVQLRIGATIQTRKMLLLK